MFGVLNLYKPLHCTSHDVVSRVRKTLKLKKVGHCGTLDPLAEGVLPVCVGDATRLIEYFPSDKRYHAIITLGITTLTWDAEGEQLTVQSAEHVTHGALQEALAGFNGVIQQQVPPHAAVHVQGKKLYEYARKGITVELPVRKTEIFECTLLGVQHLGEAHPVVELEIHCASGTYIRSMAKALGETLGVGAYLSGLVRTAHGRFTRQTSITLADFMEHPEPVTCLMNPAEYLPFPSLSISEAGVGKIRHGMKLQPDELAGDILNNRLYLLVHGDLPVAVAEGEATGRLKPLKVFANQ